MLKELAAVAGAAALMVALPAAAAQADPKGEPFTLTCDNGESYEIVTFGNGNWGPGLVLDSNEVLHPVAFDISGTFTPADGSEPMTFTDQTSKKIGNGRETTDCEFTEALTDDSGTVVIEGTVTAVVSP